MTKQKVGTREDWLAARAQLLVREKEHTRLGDDIAQQRRELPWVLLEKQYRFDTQDGERTLAELFDGRAQLIVYHFMFGPNYAAGCATCSSTADSLNGVLPHLAARDITLICISHAPLRSCSPTAGAWAGASTGPPAPRATSTSTLMDRWPRGGKALPEPPQISRPSRPVVSTNGSRSPDSRPAC